MKQFNLEFGSTFYNYACPMYIDFALYFVIFNECSCILVRAIPFYIWGGRNEAKHNDRGRGRSTKASPYICIEKK